MFVDNYHFDTEFFPNQNCFRVQFLFHDSNNRFEIIQAELRPTLNQKQDTKELTVEQ
jgi:hypothetical protein